jgi:hypothetical protein
MRAAASAMRFLVSFWLAVLQCLLFSGAANAFGSGQWDWKVVGLSPTYATKEAAYAALKNQGGAYQYLDKEENLSDLTSQWASYKYSASPISPTIGDWTYDTGSTQHSSEGAAEAWVLQYITENYSAPECPPTLTPRTGWTGSTTSWGVTTHESREYDDVRGTFSPTPTPHCTYSNPPLTYVMTRSRDVTCQSPFTPNPPLDFPHFC